MYRMIDLAKKLLLASTTSICALSPLISYGHEEDQSQMNRSIENYLIQYRINDDIKHRKFDIFLQDGGKLGEFDVTSPQAGNSVVNTVSYLRFENSNTKHIDDSSDPFSTLAGLARVLNNHELIIFHLDGAEGRQAPDVLAHVISILRKEAQNPELLTPDGVLFRDRSFIWTKKTGLSICPLTTPVGTSNEEWSSGHLDTLRTLSESHDVSQLVSVRGKHQLSSPLLSCASALAQTITTKTKSGAFSLTDDQTNLLQQISISIQSSMERDLSSDCYQDENPCVIEYPIFSLNDGTVMHGSNSHSVFFYTNESIYQLSYDSLGPLFKRFFGAPAPFPLAIIYPETFVKLSQEVLAPWIEEEQKCEALIRKYHFKDSSDVKKFYLEFHGDKKKTDDALRQELDADIEQVRRCSKTVEWRRRISGYPEPEKEVLTESAVPSAKLLEDILDKLPEILTSDFIELAKAAADISLVRVNDALPEDDSEHLKEADDQSVEHCDSVHIDYDLSENCLSEDSKQGLKKI